MATEIVTYTLVLDDLECTECKMEDADGDTPTLSFVPNATYAGAEIGILIKWLLEVAEEVGEYEV